MTTALLLALALPAFAADAPAPAPAAAAAVSSFDPSALDRTASPCTDFYQFACGGWVKAHPIPPDQSRWGRFN